ncbi:unnamed protein product [Rotaria magnacalcarata]|uniref:Uncharacterized protein n=1 Tax=Rotaria magnacalcarata TaxID=392030 RepID=A0A8S2P8H9_9BILA|nr:unnamed protein product [Rotaria magnacalcarata]
MTLNRNTNIVIDFTGSAWAGEIKMSSGVGANFWSVVALIDPTQKYPINTSSGMFATKMKKEINYYSPFLHHVSVTGSLPLIRVIEGQVAVIQIPAADWDRTADARCRWVSSTGAAGDECDDICNNLPSAVLSLSLIFTTVNRFSLFDSECTITWTAVRRPVDGALTTGTYLVAIMVEDFVNTASMTPMSPVPLQMLIYTYQPASGSCSTKPEVTGDRPNRVCIGILPGIQRTERIVATLPSIAAVSGTANQWCITLTWTPTTDQIGSQVFCAAPIDQNQMTGSQHCINFVVGYLVPNLVIPTLIQGRYLF